MENGDSRANEIEELQDTELSVGGLDRRIEVFNDQNSVTRRMERRLNQISEEAEEGTTRIDPCFGYRVPQNLDGINIKAICPEIVSIGPLHHGKDELLEFESNKWHFLDSHITRSGVELHDCTEAVTELEPSARKYYSESIPMSSDDFIEMMVLDGCFIIELFHQVCQNQESEDEDIPIFTMPWSIPILIRDLLKLENQIPYFVLRRLFVLTKGKGNTQGDCLELLALKFFNLALPRPPQTIKNSIVSIEDSINLLELFHQSYRSSTCYDWHKYRPTSDQSIQCVTRLRQAGIKFRPRRTESLLDISFRNGLLEIPPITINDFTITAFLNCVALEQSGLGSPAFSTYIAFMSCLINSGRDVAFLCEDGIVTSFSQNDQHVAELFKKLGDKVVFDVRDCYLSKQFGDLEAYYSSNWATLRRTYFRSPWSFISVFSAFVLLLFTGVQTITAIWSLFRNR